MIVVPVGKIQERVRHVVGWLCPGMQGRQIVALYIVVPIAIGALLGWYRAGYAADYPLSVSLFEWIANFYALWIAFDLGSRLIAFLLRPWAGPLWLTLMLGGAAGVAVSRPLRDVVRNVSAGFAPEARQDISLPDGLVWQEYVIAYVGVIAMPILIWVVVNYVFAVVLGAPRYGYRHEGAGIGSVEPEPQSPEVLSSPNQHPLNPEFVSRLSGGPPVCIWALQAEDHYLRVHTDNRNELIRYRFSDAVDEVQGLSGLKVHRSFWVNTEAIDSIRRAGRSYEIVLKNGLEIPVSRSYRQTVKDAGLLSRFPSKPSPLFRKDEAARTAAE